MTSLLLGLLLIGGPDAEMLSLLFKARYAYSAGKFSDALRLANRALDLDPKQAEAAMLKVEVLQQLSEVQGIGGPDQQLEVLRTLRYFSERFPEDYRFSKELGVELLTRPGLSPERGFGSPRDHLLKALSLLERDGDVDDALEPGDTLYYLGIHHYNQEEFYEAGRYFERVIALESGASWAIYYAALSQEKSHQLRSALRNYRRYLNLTQARGRDRGLPVDLNLYTLAVMVNQDADARADLLNYLHQTDLDDGIVLELTERFYDLSDLGTGLALLDAVPPEQRRGRWFDLRARGLLQQGKYDELRGEMKGILGALTPDKAYGSTVEGLMDAAFLGGHFPAIQDAAARYQNHPVMGVKVRVYHAFAAALFADDDSVWSEVAERYADVERLRPMFEDVAALGVREAARGELIRQLMYYEQWADAERVLRRPSSSPNQPAGDDLAVALYMRGAYQQAFAEYERLLSAYPDRVDLANNYGYFLTEQKSDLEKALALVERAVKAEPQNDAYLDSLGWVHFHLGNYTRAEAFILKALSFEPNDPEKLEHLGYIYEAQGKLDEARRTWSKAMRGYPAGYRKLLDKLDPP